MESSLLIAAGVSFIAGLLGYCIVRLWIQPIVRYHITKRKLDHELTRYMEQMNENTESEKKAEQKNTDATLRTARQHALALVSVYHSNIPYWYRLLLDSRQESPTEASGLLTNLSKIPDRKQVNDRIARARKIMGFK